MALTRSLSRPLILAALAIGALVLGAAGSVPAQSRQETLILASSIADYITNDPSRTFEFTSQIIDRAAYDTLVTVEPPDISVVKPRLATSWEISKDGKIYTFKLRPGVKFSSGNPLTANDVRFSFRRLKNLKDQPSFFMDPVKDVEVVNDTTVRVILTDPDASFLAALSCVPCGIVDSKTVIAHGGTDAEDGKEKDKATEWLNQNSAGSGPYKLVSFVKDVEAVLERNATHWDKKPYFAKVIFKHVANASTQKEMVERGDADVARDIDADTAATIKDGPRIKLVSGLSLNLVYLGLNNSAEVGKELADKRVRQAIAYAIDYDGLMKGLMRGAAEQPPANIPLGILGVDKSMARKRDVAKAKQLLAEAASERLRRQAQLLDSSPPGRVERATRREGPGGPGRRRHQGHARAEGVLGRRAGVPGRQGADDHRGVDPRLPRPAPLGGRLLQEGRTRHQAGRV
jgi:peptide/nickel transport system substrate-binding protein